MDFQDYENLMKHVYQTAPIGMCLFDTELRYRHVNEWLASINGQSVEAHLGRRIREVIPEVSAGVESILRRVMETGEPVLNGVVEGEIPSWPDEKRLFQHSYHAVESDEGIVVGVSCVVQDITDRARAEDALVRANRQLEELVQSRTEKLNLSELRQRHLLESTRAVPWEADLASFQFTYVGPQAEGLLGFPRMQWLDKDFWPSHIHPEDREFATNYCQHCVKLKTDFDFEYRMVAADGRTVWIHDIVNVESEAGKPKTIRGFMINITQRKKMENLLEISEGRFRSLSDDVLDNSVVGIFILDKEFNVVWINKTIEICFDVKREEILGKDKRTLIRKHLQHIFDDPEGFRETVIATYDNNTYKENFECHILGSGKREDRWLEHWSQPITSGLYKGGRVEYYTDITARKHADNALRESAARLQLATDATRIGHWDWDIPTNEVYFSPEWKRQLGYQDHEIPNRFEEWESRLHPDDLQKTFKAVEYYITGRNADLAIEFRLRHKDGSYRWLYSRVEKQVDDTGKACRLFGCHIDITDRKKAEESIKHSEARFRMIYEHAPIMIDAYDENGRCVMFNKECEKVFGWTAEDVFDHENPLVEFYPDPEIRKQIIESVTTKPEKIFKEWKQTGKDGSEKSCLWANFRLPDGLVINIGYDITDRNRAEEAIRESATRLQLATDATHIGNWDHDLRTDEVYFSPEWKRQLGFEEHEIASQFGTWESRLHPDDRERTTMAYEGYIAGRQAKYEIEFRLKHKDGSYRWIYTRGEKLCDDAGKPSHVYGCHVDITERKKTEPLLLTQRNALQALARKLLSAQEDERRRLARELHDDLSQRLAAIGIDSMSLERNVRAVSESCGEELAALNGRIREIAADIHQLSRQLHPSILDELGLVKAMKGECDAFTRRTGISISFTAPGEHTDVEKNTELTVYRIMQECLRNIAKHSQAVSASVELAVDDEKICLGVRDTGIGFDLSEEQHEYSLGMASIRERAGLLGGCVTFESAIGQGTTVNVSLPSRGLTL